MGEGEKCCTREYIRVDARCGETENYRNDEAAIYLDSSVVVN